MLGPGLFRRPKPEKPQGTEVKRKTARDGDRDRTSIGEMGRGRMKELKKDGQEERKLLK